MCKRALLFFSVMVTGLAFGQKPIVISGQVTATDGVPLNRAKVTNISSGEFAVTQKNGTFTISVPRLPAQLRFTYPLHDTLKYIIKEKETSRVKNDTLFIRVKLKPTVTELATVEITSDKIERAYDKPSIWILDYDFYENYLLLLLKEKKQYKIRLANAESQTVSELQVGNTPQKLFRDCFGNIHLQCVDTFYQLYITEKQIQVTDSVAAPVFNELLAPCITTSANYLFLRDYGMHNQAVIYYTLTRQTGDKKLLHAIVDKESYRYVSYFYNKTMAMAGLMGTLMNEQSSADQNAAREVEEDVWFYDKTLSRAVYNPLLRVRDSVFVFNHVSDTAYVYTGGGTKWREFTLTHHYLPGWQEDLIVDYNEENVYARCMRGGLMYLVKINLVTGKPEREYKLDKHGFPENIKVRNGSAYYLYRSGQDFSVRNVYRQRLE